MSGLIYWCIRKLGGWQSHSAFMHARRQRCCWLLAAPSLLGSSMYLCAGALAARVGREGIRKRRWLKISIMDAAEKTSFHLSKPNAGLLETIASAELIAKRERLYAALRELGPLLIAYSGGVDSAYLAWAAHTVLGSKMLAVIADSPSLARAQMCDALAFAVEQGIPLKIVRTDELENADYRRNDAMRCFHCKDALFGVMEQFAGDEGWRAVAYGVNQDDQGDWRPGQRAAQQHGVAAPLLEAGLTKADIRALAHDAGLRIWDKPASACLSSRIEYGRAVTREALEQVERGEDALRAMGFRQFRLRHHGDVARIEIAREEMDCALSMEVFARMSEAIKCCGFKFVALDVDGFRSGSLNAMLKVEQLR
jgi:pyridinium-3,5-biscarboxylic acid mononucleotide sulfurtransferase